MSDRRRPIPPGAVSTIRGRWQAPALAWATWVLLAVAAAGVVLPGRAGRAAAVTAVSLAIAVPLLRVAWLMFRWVQERDRLFVALGATLLAVIGAGALSAAL